MEYFKKRFLLIASGRCGSGTKKYIGVREPRRCRFCEKDATETTFREVAHAIPEFFSNRNLVTNEECDTCNKFFSENLEDHLDKYTKPSRVLAQIRGKTKIPSYKSRDKLSRIDVGDKVVMEGPIESDFATIDLENGEVLLRFDVEKHIPAAVFKAFVKIALSIIEDSNELKQLRHVINWIMNPDHSRMLVSPLQLMQIFVPGPRPIGQVVYWLFRRLPGVAKTPYAVFVLAIGNYVYQISMPSIDEAKPGGKVAFEEAFFPTPFELEWRYGNVQKSRVDLTNAHKVASTAEFVLHYEEIFEGQVDNEGSP